MGAVFALTFAGVGAGCGAGSGVADGATVTAYVAAPLCGEAKRELEVHGARAGEVRVRVICLAREGGPKRLDLAAVGANARRATEDSTTVAYIQPPGPATRFSEPILEEPGIPMITTSSGKTGMAQLLTAIESADQASLRESVADALN